MGLISVERVCNRHLRDNENPRENATPRCLMKRLVALNSEKPTNYLIEKIRRKWFFVGQKLRHKAEISQILSNFCLIFALTDRTQFSLNKFFRLKKC